MLRTFIPSPCHIRLYSLLCVLCVNLRGHLIGLSGRFHSINLVLWKDTNVFKSVTLVAAVLATCGGCCDVPAPFQEGRTYFPAPGSTASTDLSCEPSLEKALVKRRPFAKGYAHFLGQIKFSGWSMCGYTKAWHACLISE